MCPSAVQLNGYCFFCWVLSLLLVLTLLLLLLLSPLGSVAVAVAVAVACVLNVAAAVAVDFACCYCRFLSNGLVRKAHTEARLRPTKANQGFKRTKASSQPRPTKASAKGFWMRFQANQGFGQPRLQANQGLVGFGIYSGARRQLSFLQPWPA